MTSDNEILKKKILYRSTHRGFKEMDLLLGSFVKMNINKFNDVDLKDLLDLLFIEDEIIYKWYFENNMIADIPKTKVLSMLKIFKL